MSAYPRAALGLLLTISAGLAAEPPALVDGFETDPAARWGGGEAARGLVREGEVSLRWSPATTPALRWAAPDVDFGLIAGVMLQVHSAEATDARLDWRFLTPDDPGTDGSDGYTWSTPLNWQGWRRIGLLLPEFEPLGRPAGWDRIAAVELAVDLTDAHGETLLRLDEFQIIPLTAPEIARILAQRRPRVPGVPTPLGDGRALVEGFGYGADATLDGWEVDYRPELEAATRTLDLTWLGFEVELTGPGRLDLRRDYDLDVSDYWTLAVHGGVDGPATVMVGATVDGVELPAVELKDGLAVLPLQGARLEEVRVQVLGEATGRRAAEVVQTLRLDWIGVRERERIVARAHAFSNRAVLLTWERPFWGAERYFVGRQPLPIAEDDQAPTVAAGRSGLTPWLIDLPPEPGTWHYEVAPVEPTGLGLPSATAATVAERPVPTIIFADFPVELDGELSEWTPEVAGPPLRLTRGNARVSGAALTDDADLSARIWLAFDGQSLLLAADVTDDVVAARGGTALSGDAIVLMIGAVRPVAGTYDAGYELVLPLPAAAIDAPSPATWAVSTSDTGYRLEARVPLAVMQAAGMDPSVDDWLAVGLSIFDSDTVSGEPVRESVLSWTQPDEQFDGAAAALMRVRHYP